MLMSWCFSVVSERAVQYMCLGFHQQLHFHYRHLSFATVPLIGPWVQKVRRNGFNVPPLGKSVPIVVVLIVPICGLT